MHLPSSLQTVAVLLQALGSDAAQSPLLVHAGPCHDYAEVTRQLSATYHERPVSQGVQSNGNLLLVLNSATNGSWTIISTLPTGLTCILAVGQHWEPAAPVRLDSPV